MPLLMIEINLLPGGKKKTRKGTGGGVDFKAIAANIASRVKDPYLAGAVVAYVIAIATVGYLWTSQNSRITELNERQAKATADSAMYAKVIAEQNRAVAQRDSVRRQFQIIRMIDGNRYIWAHLLDEVSRALPDYTWITGIKQIGTFNPLPPKPTGDAAAARKPAADSVVGPPPLRLRLGGNTVDIQALTRFMRLLEASHYIRGVTLMSSELVAGEGGKEFTRFELEADYEPPPASILRTTQLSVKVK
ncbi:MAG: PilN domain-containing protein [Gemmatimonadetes bacterium]|nr:PilN domain-containing protein [Gemmatimonadota bacterium]